MMLNAPVAELYARGASALSELEPKRPRLEVAIDDTKPLVALRRPLRLAASVVSPDTVNAPLTVEDADAIKPAANVCSAE